LIDSFIFNHKVAIAGEDYQKYHVPSFNAKGSLKIKTLGSSISKTVPIKLSLTHRPRLYRD
jgi:hypothetical protein